ncbi:MAG: permease prefix domain 1-containing protein [bacterium]
MEATFEPGIETQIREWRTYLLRRKTIQPTDVDELEDHLRSEMNELGAVGLSGDESFLVAIKRMGGLNELSREFARERSSRLWKQLVLAGGSARERSRELYAELLVTTLIALAAALAFKAPAAFGYNPFRDSSGGGSVVDAATSFYLRNASLIALPFLVGYLAWQRRLPLKRLAMLALPFVVAAVLVNTFPFDRGGDTELLVAIHVPIVLWLVAGVTYLGGEWRAGTSRMEFIRFTGEWFIYYALIAFGGGVLCALTLGVFEAIGIDAQVFISSWVLPCGAVGAVVVVAWLVEAKQSVIENMAPVLTGVFTPLFALMLVSAIVGMAVTGNFIQADRDVLILFDVLLVLVVGLVLYSISARDAAATPTLLDAVQLVLVASALLIDLFALTSMLSRISDFGFTPNRAAGLGLNLVLLVNLGWTAWLEFAFIRGKRPFANLERWQTAYVPVYAAWAVAVVVIFPPAFGFS